MRATTVASQGMCSVIALKLVINPATTVVPRTIWREIVQRESRGPMMIASATDVAGQVTCLVTAPRMKAAVEANVTGTFMKLYIH